MENTELKKDYYELFGNNIIDALQFEDKEVVGDLNDSIFNIINKDEKFKKELEYILYNNGEQIGASKLIIDSKKYLPTIENWLKDFIKYHGSGDFDNVELTKYITKSKNAKTLEEEDKKTLKRLLILYRNLKFFPSSMESIPSEKWEIVPTGEENFNLTKARIISGPPKTKAEKDIDALKAEEEKYKSGGLEQRVIEEAVNKKKRVEELKAASARFKDGSLEKMAIEEEIKKLEE